GERALLDGGARLVRGGGDGRRIEQPRELVADAVVRRAQPRERGARLLEPRALDGRLARERLDELLVPALDRGELRHLLLGESEAASHERAGLGEDAARLRAHRRHVIDAALVQDAARDRLLEAMREAVPDPG